MASVTDFFSNLSGSSGSCFSGFVIHTEPHDSPGVGADQSVRPSVCTPWVCRGDAPGHLSALLTQDIPLAPRPSSTVPSQRLLRPLCRVSELIPALALTSPST